MQCSNLILHFDKDNNGNKILTLSEDVFNDFMSIIQKGVGKNTKVVAKYINNDI